MKKALIASSIALVLLAGCAATSSIEKSKLTASSQDLVYELSEEYRHSLSRMGHVYVYTLTPGMYKANFKDERGTYLVGPGQAVHLATNGQFHTSRVGGIYLPNDSSTPATLFFFYDPRALPSAGSTYQTTVNAVVASNATALQAGMAGAIAAAIIEASDRHEGDIIIPDGQPSDRRLRQAIRHVR